MPKVSSGQSLHVVLVGPYDGEDGRPGQYIAPPLGIHRIAHYVSRRTNAEVTVLDPNVIRLAETKTQILERAPAIVGFSTLAPTLHADLRLLSDIRDALPRSLIVVGGQGVAGLERQLVEGGAIDCVVRGFGEFALTGIVEILERGTTTQSARILVLTSSFLYEIPNLTIRTTEGRNITTPPAALTANDFASATDSFDFASVPYPDYWQRNEQRYSPAHLNLMKNDGLTKTIRLITQTHCPLGCNYCSSTRFLDVIPTRRQRVFMQTAEEVVDSIDRAIAAHPATTTFYINDDDFALHRGRALEFATLVRKRFADRFSFICMTRVDKVDRELATALAASGFRLIFLGIETFASKTLAAMDKRIRMRASRAVDDAPYATTARQAVMTLLEAGITPQIGLIPFYPSVDEVDLVTTIENAVQLVGRGARLSVFALADAYPGARMFDQGYEMTTEEIRLGNAMLTIPKQFLPRNALLRAVAEEAIAAHEEMKALSKGERLPQPIDGLLFFRCVLKLLGRSCTSVDTTLAKIREARGEPATNPLLYVNA